MFLEIIGKRVDQDGLQDDKDNVVGPQPNPPQPGCSKSLALDVPGSQDDTNKPAGLVPSVPQPGCSSNVASAVSGSQERVEKQDKAKPKSIIKVLHFIWL